MDENWEGDEGCENNDGSSSELDLEPGQEEEQPASASEEDVSDDDTHAAGPSTSGDKRSNVLRGETSANGPERANNTRSPKGEEHCDGAAWAERQCSYSQGIFAA